MQDYVSDAECMACFYPVACPHSQPGLAPVTVATVLAALVYSVSL